MGYTQTANWPYALGIMLCTLCSTWQEIARRYDTLGISRKDFYWFTLVGNSYLLDKIGKSLFWKSCHISWDLKIMSIEDFLLFIQILILLLNLAWCYSTQHTSGWNLCILYFSVFCPYGLHQMIQFEKESRKYIWKTIIGKLMLNKYSSFANSVVFFLCCQGLLWVWAQPKRECATW